MSYDTGIRTMRLQPTGRLAHTEYCDHYGLVRAVTGRDPRAWDIDFIWRTNDGPVDWAKRGRVTDMGHAEFMEDGVDRRDSVVCPFQNVEDVLAFDAVEEYGLPDMQELIRYYESEHHKARRTYPEQVNTGGYYKTIVSGAIQAFGWEMLLLAANDRRRFDRVLESFYRLTLHHVQAWAKTSIEVFIQHDDMVWTQGPFMHPEFYRSAIFSRYRKLWQVLHEAGKIVLYCSDGTFTEFVDDLAAAGADGFIFEPTTSLEYVVERYGKTHVIGASKVDCRTLTYGTKDEIRHEVEQTIALARGCPGFMVAVGNHLPANIPVDNTLFYMDYLRQKWDRS
jgi:hypothetical protein